MSCPILQATAAENGRSDDLGPSTHSPSFRGGVRSAGQKTRLRQRGRDCVDLGGGDLKLWQVGGSLAFECICLMHTSCGDIVWFQIEPEGGFGVV